MAQLYSGSGAGGWSGGAGGSNYMNSYIQAQEKANEANQKRYTEAMKLYDNMIKRFGPGGTFMSGAEAGLERTKTKDVASGSQALVSAGLSNTTMPAGLGKRWEEEIGGPQRLKLEDMRQERLTQAELGKAGLIERVEDIGPDPNLFAQLMQQGAGAPSIPSGFNEGSHVTSTLRSPRPSLTATQKRSTYNYPTSGQSTKQAPAMEYGGYSVAAKRASLGSDINRFASTTGYNAQSPTFAGSVGSVGSTFSQYQTAQKAKNKRRMIMPSASKTYEPLFQF